MKNAAQFVSSAAPEPVVKLINAFDSPYDNSVATARTCYSSRVIYADDVRKDESTRQRRDSIAKSIYLAGHHTTLQHATFQFVLEKVSRQCIWSFLHSHPFYNSEQVSQRYVSVAPENFTIPLLNSEQKELYLSAVNMLMGAYVKLQELLTPVVELEYKRLFPHRNLTEKRWQGAIKKRCQEVARYVLPVATHAHLYHTISGVTLLRYARLCRLYDAPAEQRVLAAKMVAAVEEKDPDFFKNAEDPLTLEETPEHRFFNSQEAGPSRDPSRFCQEFDQSLGGLTSKLADYKVNGQKVMAGAVRSLLGLLQSEMTDAQAISWVMDPAKNSYLSETLNVTHHTKLSRAMAHPHFTFRKKISHTADSQDQRHRTTPGSRPVLARHFSRTPDYVLPKLIRSDASAQDYYESVMEDLWLRMEALLNSGAEMEATLYLLPNAFPIRFEESGSLLDFHHKWSHRLCYTAQEEIWQNCLEEVRQVREIAPEIAQYLYAPCTQRAAAGRKPFCPEGDRYCGVPVWTQTLNQYERIL